MGDFDEHDDPFYQVKDEVQNAADTAEAIFTRWQELLKSTNTAENDEFDWTTQELIDNLKTIEQDLEALDETVGIVEKNMERFHLTPFDIDQRKRFIVDTRTRITDIHGAINHPETRQKMEQDQRKTLIMTGAANAAQDLRGNLIIDDEKTEQMELMGEQDDIMGEIGHSVDIVHELATEMNAELRAQNTALEDTNKNSADLLDRVKVSSKKLTDLLENSTSTTQKCAMMIILTLSLITMVYFTFLW